MRGVVLPRWVTWSAHGRWCAAARSACKETRMQVAELTMPAALRVGDVVLADASELLTDTDRRQRASLELLRQASIEAGLLAEDDPAPEAGVISEAAAEAIDQYLLQQLRVPEPDEPACRRHHAAHAAQYAIGERVQARHILFAVTPGVDVQALRLRAEQALLEVRADPN